MATISLLFVGFLVSGLEAVTGTKRALALYIVYIAYIMTVSICVCNSELLFAYIVHIVRILPFSGNTPPLIVA
jgi:hypothetical protein